MFLKKSLFFTTALALLMFAGQASAQPGVSLEHVTDGTAGMVAGSGTVIMVKVSQTGVNAAISALLPTATSLDIEFAFNTSYVSLTNSGGLFPADTESGATLTVNAPPGGALLVPAEATLTFTTAADVTDVEFSIGITGARVVGTVGGQVQQGPIPISKTLTFNEGATGMPPGDGNGDNGGDNGDTGMPTPMDVTASLTSGGESTVNQVGAGAEIVVDVTVSGLTGQTAGAKIVFAVDPPVAAITGGMPAEGLGLVPSETSGMQVVIAGLPMMLADGNLGSVTFATGPDYDGSTFSIGVASFTAFTTVGEVSVAAGDPLTVNDFSPSLEASANEVTVPHGETATATVTAIDTEGAVEFTVDPADAGTVSDDGNSVTVSATGNATVTVSATAGGVATNSVTIVFTKAPPVLMTESTEVVFDDFGAMASVSVTAAGFDEGAEINFSYEATADFQAMEDGSSLTITTGAPGTVTVTASDGTASASLTITFSNPDPYLTADPDPADVIIPEGGEASVTVSATGLEGVISYTISKTSGTATIAADTDGGMVTLTASGEGSAMVSVTASAGGMTTEAVDIIFREMPSVGSDATDVVAVPQATVPSAMAMVVATGFPEGAEITFNVDPDPSDQSLSYSVEGR